MLTCILCFLQNQEFRYDAEGIVEMLESAKVSVQVSWKLKSVAIFVKIVWKFQIADKFVTM